MNDESADRPAVIPTPPPDATANGTAPANNREDTAAALRALTERVDLLVVQGEESNRISQERERIVDRLHTDVQALRQGEIQQAIAPLLRDLIKLFDDLDRAVMRPAVADDRAAPGPSIGGYRDDVCDILFRYGIERYDAPEGARFDPREHRAVATVETQVPEQDGCLARITRSGFRSGLRIVRHLEAHVFRHVEAASRPTPPSGTE